MRMRGKFVIVTGASTGISRAVQGWRESNPQ